MRAAAIKTHQVWVSRSETTRTRSRRVIGLAGGKVCYSTGSNQTRWCQLRAFRRWIASHAAITTRTRRTRSLTLRAEARA